MKNQMSVLTFCLMTFCLRIQAAEDPIPSHPRELKFDVLDYSPPEPSDSRKVLKNGVVGYFVEDHDLPLVNLSFLIRTGDYLDPEGKTGVAGMVGQLLRTGGTEKWKADEFDEEADFLAANISSSIGGWSGSANVNALSKDLDAALEMFFEMLRRPAFQQDRIDLARSQILQQMERRNDQTQSIENREWTRLLRGDRHFTSRMTTKSSIDSITREDLLEFHRAYFHPDNFIVAASGDFDTSELQAKLEAAMDGWEGHGRAPEVPSTDYQPAAGIYMVDKIDVNQGRVSLGHLGIQLGNPDEYAIDLMNEILGGGGFTSRILARVRSDEGLAYSAGSSFTSGVHYPGIFRAFFQSKSATCAEAAQIILDEVRRIRNEKVSQEELDTVKTNAIETFPRRFSSAAAVANTFAFAELVGLERDYYQKYRDRIRAVTVDDILRVAREYLHPDRLVILAVGHVLDMQKGNSDKPEYSFQRIAGEKGITRIPLPDPLTMVYP